MNEKYVITIKEAAMLSGLSEYAVRLGVKQGLFPSFRFESSGKYHIPRKQFLEVIDCWGTQSFEKMANNEASARYVSLRRID